MEQNRKKEEKLSERISRGDIKAFEQLYNDRYVYLCAVATSYVYDREAAKEIVNDVFLNVWHHRASLHETLHAYLMRAVRNRCLNHIRDKQTKEMSLTHAQEQLLKIKEEAIMTDEHPLAWLENRESEQLIARAIETLPDKCKTIFKQHLYRHKSYEEIANLNDISSSTVRVQIRIGLLKIKDLLHKYYKTILWGIIIFSQP